MILFASDLHLDCLACSRVVGFVDLDSKNSLVLRPHPLSTWKQLNTSQSNQPIH